MGAGLPPYSLLLLFSKATPRPRSGAAAERSNHTPEVRAVAERSYPQSEVRGGGREEQPQVQGAAAARSQEGREELLHMKGEEGWQ